MGLIISTFKKNGQTFNNTYAKVSNVRYDNDSKIASFGIKVYVSKEDKNLITEIQNQWVRIVGGADMVAQCYDKIDSIITQTNTQIAREQAKIDDIVDNDNLKLMKENRLNVMRINEILQFEGSVEE